MRERDLRLAPGDVVEDPAESRGRQGQRVHAGTDVMAEAGAGQAVRPHAPAGLVGGLQDGDVPARLGQRHRGDQPVRPGAHDDRILATSIGRAHRRRLCTVGPYPLSG